MKELFEELTKKVTDVAEVVGKKTEEVVGVQKVKSQIRNLKRNNLKNMMDLGKVVYSKYDEEDDIDPAFLELCEEIKRRETVISELEDLIMDMQGKEICKICGTLVEKDATFCSKCGAKLEEEPDVEESIFEEETSKEPEFEEVEAEVMDEEVEKEEVKE